MNNQIFKYPLKVTDGDQHINLPLGWVKLVLCGMQYDEIMLWYEINGSIQKTVTKKFRVYPTGMEIDKRFEHVASCQDSEYVWHVYMEKTP